MLVVRERIGAVEVLTLNRPDAANALNGPLMGELGTALSGVLRDPRVRAVVLTGAGDRVFCAGMDLGTLGRREESSAGAEASTPDPSAGDESPAGDAEAGPPVLARFMAGDYAKPVIAAVNGAAAGGGLELVLACDLVVAADHARFGLPEVTRGLFPAGGGTLLAQRVPQALALEMGLTGRLVDVPRAVQAGLVNLVVTGAELRMAATALAQEVAGNGPLAVQLTKRLMRRAVQEGAEAGRATPDETRAIFESADAREGARAFMEKRAPVFSGQ